MIRWDGLLTSDNPEDTGLIQYAYDDNGNVTQKIDARGVTSNMLYDALNRVTEKNYTSDPTNTPTSRYCYDGEVFSTAAGLCQTAAPAIPYALGKLTGNGVVGLTATNFTDFDAMGRVKASTQTTETSPGYTSYNFTYGYNLDGTLATEQYPSGKTFSLVYDQGGFASSLSAGAVTYVPSATREAHGAIAEIALGNGLVEQTCFNDRLQPTIRRLGTASQANCANASALLHLTFNYGAATANNGNLMSQAINLPSFSQTQYYEYDEVNRLKVASEGAAIPGSKTCPATSSWCREYGYEHFGNRWVAYSNNTLHMATPTSAADFDAATNRLAATGVSYDAAGNLTAHPYITIGGGSIIYDANNKQATFTKTATTVDTWYDAQDRRVRKVINGSTTIYVYGAGGKLAAEYTTAPSNTPEGTYYRTTDHLGSTRIVTDAAGAVKQRRDFFPFGEEIPADSSHGNRNLVMDSGVQTYNAAMGVTHQFTGQQRDDETGLDYFWARNHSAQLGRFLSIDPENSGVHALAPQTWNAYSYVMNHPFKYVDVQGTDPDPAFDSWECIDISDCPWLSGLPVCGPPTPGLPDSGSPDTPDGGGSGTAADSPSVADEALAEAQSYIDFLQGFDVGTIPEIDRLKYNLVISAFLRNFIEMKIYFRRVQNGELPNPRGNDNDFDKYFHCKANCESAQSGSAFESIAESIGNAKEVLDRLGGQLPELSAADQDANRLGRKLGRDNPAGDCGKLCRDAGLGEDVPSEY